MIAGYAVEVTVPDGDLGYLRCKSRKVVPAIQSDRERPDGNRSAERARRRTYKKRTALDNVIGASWTISDRFAGKMAISKMSCKRGAGDRGDWHNLKCCGAASDSQVATYRDIGHRIGGGRMYSGSNGRRQRA